MERVTLTPSSLDRKGVEGFFISKRNGLFFLGFQRMGESDTLNTETPISEEFYNAFLKESDRYREKYNKIFESKL